MMKYVNSHLVTEENIIKGVGTDNEFSDFRFKDYEDIIAGGKYVDIDSEEEKLPVNPKNKYQKKVEYMKNLDDNIERMYEKKFVTKKVENPTEIVDSLRKKKILKKSSIFEGNQEQREIGKNEKEEIDFNEVKNKMKWFN